jgi:hypothetical protein
MHVMAKPHQQVVLTRQTPLLLDALLRRLLLPRHAAWRQVNRQHCCCRCEPVLRLLLLQPPPLARQEFGGAWDAAHVQRAWQWLQVAQDLWVALLQRLRGQNTAMRVHEAA